MIRLLDTGTLSSTPPSRCLWLDRFNDTRFTILVRWASQTPMVALKQFNWHKSQHNMKKDKSWEMNTLGNLLKLKVTKKLLNSLINIQVATIQFFERMIMLFPAYLPTFLALILEPLLPHTKGHTSNQWNKCSGKGLLTTDGLGCSKRTKCQSSVFGFLPQLTLGLDNTKLWWKSEHPTPKFCSGGTP